MIPWTGSGIPLKKVGIIGCGTMGSRMVECLVSGGFEVLAYDPSPPAAEFARKAGADTAESVCELASCCNVIIMSLPGPAEVESVVLGPGGIFENLTSDHVLIDTSTVDPGTSRSAGRHAGEKGAVYLDCPILGRPSAAGKWMLPTGGDEKVLDYVRPILLCFAANAVHVGPQGTGNTVKLLNQLMFSTINAISSELLAICARAGIDKEVFYRTVGESSAATVSGLFREAGKTIINESYCTPNFSLNLLLKDTKLALQMAKDAGAPSAIAGSVQPFNELAVAEGLGTEDTSALYKIFSSKILKGGNE